MPKLPHSKGLDQRVSEPEDLSRWLSLVKVEEGCRWERGLPSSTVILGRVKTTFPTIAPYKWERGQKQIVALTKFSLGLIPNSPIPHFSQSPLCSLYKCRLGW